MTDKSSEAFEAWASDNGQNPKAVERNQHGNYKLMQTNSLWMGWQAGRNQAIEACIAAVQIEHLMDNLPCREDRAYDMAIDHVTDKLKELL